MGVFEIVKTELPVPKRPIILLFVLLPRVAAVAKLNIPKTLSGSVRDHLSFPENRSCFSVEHNDVNNNYLHHICGIEIRFEESVGFEPTSGISQIQFSRLSPSSTRPTFLVP